MMDDGEEPGLAQADQVVWFVANDLDSISTLALYGSPPIGLEVQVTLWAYNRRGSPLTEALQNIIFKRYRLIYKGTIATPDTAHIDSMYVAQFSDPDVGYLGDDLVGCDTLRSIGYCYNSTFDPVFQEFNLPPPAIGYVLVQGPRVFTGNPQDEARFNLREVRGALNRGMDAFAFFSASPERPPFSALQWWNLFRSYRPRPECLPDPWLDPTGKPTKFRVPGDPVTGTGWLDANPDDRRMHLVTGPFSMALGDTQEVIIAVVGGLGPGHLASVSTMKYNAGWARLMAASNFSLSLNAEGEEIPEPLPKFFQLHQNFPNPFNPSTEIRYELPAEFHVRLYVFNILGQKVKTLVDETQTAGRYSAFWDGTNDRGDAAPSGLYFYKIELGRFSEIKKMLLVR